MNSSSTITFGCSDSEMDPSLCLDRADDEEDNFDAFNDETFGTDAFDGDWEQEHEKFAQILEHGNESHKTNCLNPVPSKHSTGNAFSNQETINDIERCLSILQFSEQQTNASDRELKQNTLSLQSTVNHLKSDNKHDDMQRALYQNLSSIWNTSPVTTKAQPFNNTAHTSPLSKASDVPKMHTLEEIESDMLKNVIKRPMRVEELEANLLHENSTSISLPNKTSVVRDLNSSFDAVSGIPQLADLGWNPLTNIGGNISDLIPNGKVQTGGNVAFNELNKSTSKDKTAMKVSRERTPEKTRKEIKANQDDVERRAEHWRANPLTGTRSPLLTRDMQHMGHHLYPPALASPVPFFNAANPLIPHQIPKQMLLYPNSPFGSPFPRPLLPHRPQMLPFPYANQVRNMNPFAHVARLPNRNMCFVPLNRFPPHPLLHQQQQQALQQQHQQQHRNFQQRQNHPHSNFHQSGNRNRNENGDAYAGFMTQKEKDWLIKIQLMQLESENPYVEDYYYVTKMSRKIAESRNKNNQKEGKTSQTTALVLPERAKTVTENTNNYTPRQFEGSLGKISVCNVHCPRKLLDVNKKEMTQDPERPSTPSARQELKKFRHLLLEIEKMYVLMLNIDDEDKRINALPEEAKKERLQYRKELCEKLFNGITDTTHDRINLKMANIRKGCSLIFRSLLLFTEPKHKAIITGELLDINNFSFVVTQKDQTIYGLDYGQILIDCIKSINDCDFAVLLHVANSLNDVATVAKYPCGEEIIETILAQSLQFEKTKEEESKWRMFVNHVLDEIEDIARLRKLCSEHLSQLSS